MNKGDSPNYHDYVIKDGKLVGEFEKMYQACEDPWQQSTRESSAYEKTIGLEILKKYSHTRPIELGCGLGYYTNQLKKKFGNAMGVDVSQTAIDKASGLFPQCSFYAGDILDSIPYKEYSPDCILCIEITWYILEKLDRYKKFLSENFGGGTTGFFHTLMTYGEGEQKYGTDYFTNLNEIRKYFSDTIDILEWGQLSKVEYNGGARTYFYGLIK